ncbi:CotH kinase family protein [Cytobacillus kochii]|uniref:CotH kinase family protein n=1 Tax=Cytobacillus kochii TaxID=859143 RepID=UPI00277D3790|nr:CotH kinase family protein [Cytobacillus kochii]MDQ0186808.1 spore coat protein CotH [Cytobacillus kochii]
MIKRKYVVLVFLMLAVLFVGILFFLPHLLPKGEVVDHSYVSKVFNKNKVTQVELTLAEDDWEDILENPTEEEYKMANVTINGTKLNQVAVRTKGNSSLSSVARMEDSDRYSFKIDFDYYTDQTLYGLKKLNLNNQFSDATQMREYLSYQLMENMGLPTPAYSYMYVTINGQEWGLYLGVEQVDEEMLGRYFENPYGSLYKPDGTNSDLKWVSDDIDDYSGLNLKSEEQDEQALIDMLDSINNGGNLEKTLDVDQVLRYFAVNTAVVSMDSYQGQMKHNYYLYENDGKFSIIPWDYNMAFGGFGVGMGGGGRMNGDSSIAEENQNKNQNQEQQALAPGEGGQGEDEQGQVHQAEMGNFDGGMGNSNLMSEDTINFSISEPVAGTSLDERPLLNALLANDEFKKQYEAYLEKIAEEYMTKESYQNTTTQISTLILPYVEQDPTKFYTTEEFLQAVQGDESLPAFAEARSESILAQLSGELEVESQASEVNNMFPSRAGGDDQEGQERGEVFQPPNGNEGNIDGEMPERPQGNGDFPQEGDFETPEGFEGMPGGEGRGQEEQPSTVKFKTSAIILYVGLITALLGTTFFIFLFKRRGR